MGWLRLRRLSCCSLIWRLVVPSLAPAVNMLRGWRSSYWTPECSWCARRHLAWQPPPLLYECMCELLYVALDKSICLNALNVSVYHTNIYFTCLLTQHIFITRTFFCILLSCQHQETLKAVVFLCWIRTQTGGMLSCMVTFVAGYCCLRLHCQLIQWRQNVLNFETDV